MLAASALWLAPLAPQALNPQPIRSSLHFESLPYTSAYLVNDAHTPWQPEAGALDAFGQPTFERRTVPIPLLRGVDLLLAYWNADLPPAAGACLDVRVQTDPSHWTPWTTWLCAGNAPIHARCAALQAPFPAARDFLRPGEHAQAMELRLRTYGLAPGASWLRRLGIYQEDRDRSGEPRDRRQPRGLIGMPDSDAQACAQVIALPVAPLATSSATADPSLDLRGPACVAMLLAYYGTRASVAEVAARAYDGETDGFDSDAQLAQAASTFGLRASLRRFDSVRTLESWISHSRPVCLRLEPDATRARPRCVLITGFSEDGDAWMLDPAALAPPQLLPRATLITTWLQPGGTALLVHPPPNWRPAPRS